MKCSFCSDEITRGTGTMLVKTDGKIFYFCSSKCNNNFSLGRNPKKVHWIRKKPASQKSI